MESELDEAKPLDASNPLDFRKIYEETMQMLYRISFLIVNDEEAAEDFESQEDRAYFSEHNIQKVFSM